MTGEPVHTVSKERMEPEVMFLTECATQISITDSKVKCPHYTLLSAMFSPLHSTTNDEQVGEVPLQSIQSPRKIQTILVGKPSCYHELTLLADNEKWDVKEEKVGPL